jgi:hypothetical protein
MANHVPSWTTHLLQNAIYPGIPKSADNVHRGSGLSKSLKNLSNVPVLDLTAPGFIESNELLGNTKSADVKRL